MAKRHRQPVCACTTTADGRQQRCRPHRLAHELRRLREHYRGVVDLIGTPHAGRSGRGAGGRLSVPINVTALDLAAGWYEDVDEVEQPGVVFTVLGYQPGPAEKHRPRRLVTGLELEVRQAVGEPRPAEKIPTGYDGLGEDPRVHKALDYLERQAERVAGDPDLEHLVDRLLEQLHRINGRAASLLYGPKITEGWETCPTCRVQSKRFPRGTRLVRAPLSTVVGKPARLIEQPGVAVCLNPGCDEGYPTCWQWDPDFQEWTQVPRPAANWRGDMLPELDLGEVFRLIDQAAEAPRLAGTG